MNTTSVEITAGLGGFLVLFGLALVLWFLGRDLSRRLRRMRLREEERLRRLEQEQGGDPDSPRARAPDEPDGPHGPGPAGDDGPGPATPPR